MQSIWGNEACGPLFVTWQNNKVCERKIHTRLNNNFTKFRVFFVKNSSFGKSSPMFLSLKETVEIHMEEGLQKGRVFFTFGNFTKTDRSGGKI